MDPDDADAMQWLVSVAAQEPSVRQFLEWRVQSADVPPQFRDRASAILRRQTWHRETA